MRLAFVYFLVSLLVGCQPNISNSTTKAPHKLDKPIQVAPIKSFSAHWLKANTLVIKQAAVDGKSLYLFQPTQPNNKIKLQPISTPIWLNRKFPHLADFHSFKINLAKKDIKQWLKRDIAIGQLSANNTLINSTFVQIANVVDDVYTSGAHDANEITSLGASIDDHSVQFKLWAPTAQSVNLQLFDLNNSVKKIATVAMKEQTSTGVWHAKEALDLVGKYYRYQIKVYHPRSNKIETFLTTDPYSLNLSANSEYSHTIDLSAPNNAPEGWHQQKDNKVAAPEDNIFYETHIRDFSAYDHSLSNNKHRGKYLAFSEKNSQGINHLKVLKEAGINSIHLLPAFDIATVNEKQGTVIDINDPLHRLCQQLTDLSACEHQAIESISIKKAIEQLPAHNNSRQAIISAMRGLDNYNWGYDPFHYTVPEGSYATNANGNDRIIEFRQMVQSLHNLGFRVIMDVVYNHTHQAGLAPTAVLDKIVPNYYHRLDPITGAIAQSTCCDNTATERAMMEKLMIDSLVVWARDYKIDGFRFDLMAHQPKAAMLRARKAVQAVDADTYFYGEGWNFGEVANNQRFTQASQLELAGTSIGTFTDRLRDAVRGGAFSASGKDIRKSQGIGNGLMTIPNELQNAHAQNKDLANYFLMTDQLRIGLAGNLANFPLNNSQDKLITGEDVPYGDQPTGYALDPADSINYVSKHDNQTLWDNNQYRIAYQTSTDDRVRMQLLSLSYVLFGQGIPFIHMGSELLRSKSFLRDSYDYGDWFNKVDFSKKTNNYNVGLPPADKDQQNWSMITEVLTKNEGRDHVSSDDIQLSYSVFLEMVKIRMSSPLFRLKNADDIINKVTFHNTGSAQKVGLIIMSIEGDKQSPSIIIAFNSSPEKLKFSFEQAAQYQLHPIQQTSVDKTVQTASTTHGVLSIPPLTSAVFIKKMDQ